MAAFRPMWLAAIEAFNRHDFQAAFADLPRDIVFQPLPDLPGAVALRGPQEMKAFYRDVAAEFPDWHVEAKGLSEPTPGVLFATHVARGTGRASGAPVEVWVTAAWDLRSGALRVSEHRNDAEARHGLGLPAVTSAAPQ